MDYHRSGCTKQAGQTDTWKTEASVKDDSRTGGLRTWGGPEVLKRVQELPGVRQFGEHGRAVDRRLGRTWESFSTSYPISLVQCSDTACQEGRTRPPWRCCKDASGQRRRVTEFVLQPIAHRHGPVPVFHGAGPLPVRGSPPCIEHCVAVEALEPRLSRLAPHSIPIVQDSD